MNIFKNDWEGVKIIFQKTEKTVGNPQQAPPTKPDESKLSTGIIILD